MTKFLLLLGPSGVGKSTIIHQLQELDDRFIYISPYITRPLRVGEQDKISITDKVMNKISERGEFLTINELFGIRYATPKLPIIKALRQKRFPVLDWPVNKMDIMHTTFSQKLFAVYIAPPSFKELRERISKDGRDVNGSRFKNARKELQNYWAGKYGNLFDLEVVNNTGKIVEVSKKIYRNYLDSLFTF